MGALAWAGLVFVIAVPSAEVVRSKLTPANANAATAVAPVAAPTKAKPVVATAAPTAKPSSSKPAPAGAATTDVADAPAVPADPIKDYLAEGKPLPDYITTGKASAPAAAAASQPAPAALPTTATTTASAKPAVVRPKPTVTEADLKDWKSGTLEDYLRQHGLLTDSAPVPAGN